MAAPRLPLAYCVAPAKGYKLMISTHLGGGHHARAEKQSFRVVELSIENGNLAIWSLPASEYAETIARAEALKFKNANRVALCRSRHSHGDD